MPAGFRRHLVGKTLINVFRCDITEIYALLASCDHTDIFINQPIKYYLNNGINLLPLTPHIMPCYTHKMAIVTVDSMASPPYMYSRHTIALFSLLLQSSQSVDAKSVSHRRRRRPRKCLDTLPPAASSIAPTNSICRRLRGTARAPTRFACQSSASPAPPPSLRHRRRRSISSCTGCVRRLSEARPRLQWDGTSRARVSARFWLGGQCPLAA